LAQAIVSIDVPSQTLSLSLTGNTENEDNQKMIEANVNTFINEAKTIPKLTQIHIEVLVTAEEKDKTVYNETFLRKKDDQKFSKIENTSSDQKGKG
jgi:signal peptidase I